MLCCNLFADATEITKPISLAFVIAAAGVGDIEAEGLLNQAEFFEFEAHSGNSISMEQRYSGKNRTKPPKRLAYATPMTTNNQSLCI